MEQDVTSSSNIKEYSNGQTLAREYIIGLPQVSEIHKVLQEALAHNPDELLTQVEDMNSQEFKKLFDAFHASKTILFDAISLAGLGDSIESMRYGILAAKYLSDKQFIIEVNPKILEIDKDLLNLPPNVTLIPHGRAIIFEPSTTFLFNAISLPGARFGETQRILTNDQIAWQSPINNTMLYKMLGYQTSEKTIFDDISFISSDFSYVAWLLAMGIPLNQKDLTSSFLQKLESEEEKQYDLLIAPDAAELSRTGKSEKSLSIYEWGKIFDELAKLSPTMRVGIIRGVAHPEYCQRVFQAAQRAHLQVREEVTSTLSDFIRVLNSTKIFAGADSGTTHLANEVALTNTNLRIRELFTYNGNLPGYLDYKLDRYGIRGLDDRGKVLQIVRKDREPLPLNLSGTSHDIAEFISR